MLINIKIHKYKILSKVKTELLAKIKLVFIFHSNGNDIIIITKEDQVYGFGYNNFGRLGFGHHNEVTEPTIIKELCHKNINKISAGNQFMVGISKTGHVYSWGYGYVGQLGNGQDDRNYRVPTRVVCADNIPFINVNCCNSFTFLISNQYTVYWFGWFNNNQETMTIKSLSLDKCIIGLDGEKIVDIKCGMHHALAVSESNNLYVCGCNESGELGLGHTKHVNSLIWNQFVKHQVEKIACGSYHSIILCTDGTICSFGFNGQGQLGIGTTVDQNKPTIIRGFYKFVDLFAFKFTSMALCEAGFVWVWGECNGVNVLEPMRTEFSEFQEVLDYFVNVSHSHTTLTYDELFEPINDVNEIISNEFNREEYSDLKFLVENKFIYAHKWVVAENCKYFDSLFTKDWSEKKINIIEINGHSYETYYMFIQYLYMNSIDCTEVQVLIDILNISNEYNEEILKSKCIQQLKLLLSINNACSIYLASLKFTISELSAYCLEFIMKNIDNVMQTEGFKQTDDIMSFCEIKTKINNN